jgi:hypothetical protein
VRKFLALAVLALLGVGAVFVSIESEATALAGGPTVSCASHPPPMAAVAALAHRLLAPSCTRVASAR